MLFNKRLLHTRIEHFNFPIDAQYAHIQKIISGWQAALKDSDLNKTKETSIQGLFLQKFFEDILGYTTQVSGTEEYHLIQHPKTEIDAKEADGALGFFGKDKTQNNYRVVIELKDAKTPLDKKQKSRKENYTPVEQAFGYLSKFDRCDWVIVSNFREIRLYHKSRGQVFYEKFDVLTLHEDRHFKYFYYLLCRENLLDKQRNSPVDQLVQDTTEQEEDISKAFYKEFQAVRLLLFEHIAENNPAIEKKTLLEKTQKLLDRMIFVLFCEDSGLLPANIAKDCYDLGNRSRERSDQKIWREFKNLFMDIDEGRDDVDPAINAYDGGLFKEDLLLNNLVIKDPIWEAIIPLARYNFESDLNVNILGHIFEQSLSDLERLKAELDGMDTEGFSKRKKEGIFYTPEYITRYIVERTVGRYLEDHPDKLGSIKILDPACGSGAFLNQAHSFLREQYQTRFEERITAADQLNIFEHIDLAAIDSGILLNNLYGVDLNEESTEISKLSLWLKTAKKTEPLQNLDQNIKCGNSLVSEAKFAAAKAFDWNQAFPDILNSGGFDVVIGNPPYVRQELFSDIKPYLEQHFEVYSGVADLYVYFFERGLQLLKEGGYFSFIVSNKFLKAGYGKKLTQYLQKNYTLLEIIDFGDIQIFEGATTYPCIMTIQKQKATEQTPQVLPLQSVEQSLDLKTELKQKGYPVHIHLDDEAWSLSNPKISRLFEKIKAVGVPLGEYVNDRIYYGIKTGLNQAFVIDEATRQQLISDDPRSAEIIKPFLVGKDIKRYQVPKSNRFVIFARRGIDINQYPAVLKYLETFKTQLMPKPKDWQRKWPGRKSGSYQWYEIQDSIAYYQEFETPKILWPEIAQNARFAWDDQNYYANNKAFLIPEGTKYLMGILNSSLLRLFIHSICTDLQGDSYNFSSIFVKRVPIRVLDLSKPAEKSQHDTLEQQVDKILKLTKELQENTTWALDLLQAEYGLKKIPPSLQNFYELGWNLFDEELAKKKVKLKLNQKEELMKWFRDKQSQLQGLAQEIAALDRAIDRTVYALYGLTEEEIQQVESA